MKTTIRLSFVFLSLGLFIVGCGSDAPDPAPTDTTIVEPAATEAEPAPTQVPTNEPMPTESEPEVAGPFRIGVNANSIPPLTIIEGDTYSGFEIDIASEVIARLYGDEATIEWVPITSQERFSSLAEGQIDMLVRIALHTVSREELALFSGGYLLSGNAFLAFPERGYSTISDLDGENIATLSFLADELSEVANRLGYTFSIIAHEALDEAQGSLGFSRAAALYHDWVLLASILDPEVHALLTDNSLFGPMGIAFALGEENLRDEVNGVLNEIIADGTWQSIFDKWFGIAVPWNVEEMLDWPAVDR